MFSSIYKFFDKLEDWIRGRLSHKPILYACVGGLGVVLLWRGVWHSVDYLMTYFFLPDQIDPAVVLWWDGPLSLFVGVTILLASGVFVSSEIGNEVIISGLRGEKKIIDKTREELESDSYVISSIQKDIKVILKQLKKTPKKKKNK